MSLIRRILLACSATFAGSAQGGSETPDDKLWQRVYEARAKAFSENFGKLPEDILKLGDLAGVWPGGGLFVVPASKLGGGHVVYATFGLSNPDMPTQVTISDLKTETDGARMARTQGTLQRKENARPRTDRAGYGYELIVVANENSEWPLWLLQWAVKAEMIGDADFLGRVEKYNGLTVEQVQAG